MRTIGTIAILLLLVGCGQSDEEAAIETVQAFTVLVEERRGVEAIDRYYDLDLLVDRMMVDVELSGEDTKRAVSIMRSLLIAPHEDEFISYEMSRMVYEDFEAEVREGDDVYVSYVAKGFAPNGSFSLDQGALLRKTPAGWRIVDSYNANSGRLWAEVFPELHRSSGVAPVEFLQLIHDAAARQFPSPR